MSLDKKSLTELRAIAQSLGIELRWDIGREHLLQEINNHVAAKVIPPEKPIEINIKQDSNAPVVTKEQLETALRSFCDMGLHLSFPDEYTWEMRCDKKHDSGTMQMPIWNIIQCARDMVKS